MRLGCRSKCVGQRKRNRRFNEAEANAPRMRVSSVQLSVAVDGASMRPRRMRLGCKTALPTYRRAMRRFNEAEANAPRMRRRPVPIFLKRYLLQ